ncbi:hypothetical protein [Weissella confusa]|uniref:hypothetical protein n=1 Tax=Weissella confusa TaxID=1583 RepID=UPI0022FE12A5|nr:hypothetical protein [Weissella confusa]
MSWVVYLIALIGFIRSCTSSDQLPPIIVVFFVLLVIKIFTGSFLAGLLYWGFVIVTAFVSGIVGQIIGVMTLEGDALNVQMYGLLILSMIIVGWYGLKLMLTGKIGKKKGSTDSALPNNCNLLGCVVTINDGIHVSDVFSDPVSQC